MADGIVIVGGGKYFAAAYCNARLIRRHGCRLPIELWYLGRNNEMPCKWQDILKPYNVTCFDADERALTAPMRILNGWELKFYAVQQSSFQRVLHLDADCYPMRDPTFCFSDPHFVDKGAVFQRDCAKFEFIKPDVLEMFGIPSQKIWDLETGAFMVDKAKWGKALDLTVFLNSYSDLVYKVVYGDKTTPALAARLAKQPYAIPPHPPGGRKWGLMQKWFNKENMWMHLIHKKPTLQTTSFTSSQTGKHDGKTPYQSVIHSYLEDLRKLV